MRRSALQAAGDRLGWAAYLTVMRGRLPVIEEILAPWPEEPPQAGRTSASKPPRPEPTAAPTSPEPVAQTEADPQPAEVTTT